MTAAPMLLFIFLTQADSAYISDSSLNIAACQAAKNHDRGPTGLLASYTGRVVGNGLHAQRQNPEVKVRSPNPTLAEVKERMERFNQVG
eukprot:superscaffoldBa00000264_g3309